MVDPGLALLVFAVVAAVLSLLFWPKWGLVARFARLARMTERVRIEDALKHLYGGEYAEKPCSIDSVAGALEISRARSANLVAHLEALQLIRSNGVGLPLTDTGRSYALRLLRTHRLWERYLADRTNVSPADWHDEAEKAEHTMKPEETEALAARMGQPLYDPHGDPIPTAAGDMPPREGVALTALKPGQNGAIVHLEDEPREVFQQIVDIGLAPLMRLRLEESTPEVVRFTADGRECELEPVAATNVTVVPLPRAELGAGPFDHLGDLTPGESGTVVQISPLCQGLQRRRLLDLGFVPGTSVDAELRGASGDPIGYRVRGALIALRREQAEWIYVQRGNRQVAH
jgi:DtxR family Mn-dependent transcriptional regulator